MLVFFVLATSVCFFLCVNLSVTWDVYNTSMPNLTEPSQLKAQELQKGVGRRIVTISDLRSKLVLEPPIAGMDIESGQIPWKNYTGFSRNVLVEGHNYTRTRTYSSKMRNESCQRCFPFIYKNVLSVKPCDANSSLKVLLLVTTVPMENTTRIAIRDTWGRNTNSSRTVFLFGIGSSDAEQQILIDESNLYGDILQENYLDTYLNLSVKVLSGLHWWSKHCHHTPYVLRTAADNFVNMPNLLALLDSGNVSKEVIIGHCRLKDKPIRNVTNKYYVHINEYPNASYPPFCIGTTLVRLLG